MARKRKSKKRSSPQRDLQSKHLPKQYKRKTVLRRSYEMPFKVAFAIKFKRRLREPQEEPGSLIDGRMFDPTGPVARTIDGRIPGIRYSRERRSRRRPLDHFSNKVRFEHPKRVAVCRRRSEKRRALFANQKAGKGRRITTRKKRNEYSEVKC